MSWPWLVVAGIGLAVAAAAIAAARHPTIPVWEMRVFRRINRLPDWLYPTLWPPMQLGNLVVGTVVGLAAAAVTTDAALGAGVILAMLLKLVTERILRREMAAYLTVRERPGTSEPGAILRGDVPAEGPSFPSGHVILVAAVSCVIAPILPPQWVAFAALCTVLVMVGRVYVGAHNPLDVAAGLGAGLLLGGVLAAFVG